MSVLKLHRHAYLAYCDCCGKELPVEPDYVAAVEAIHRENWKSVRIDGRNYEDYCKDCMGED